MSILCLVWLVLAAPAFGAQIKKGSTDSLFVDAGQLSQALPQTSDVGVVRSRAVLIRAEALAEPGAPVLREARGRERIDLNLFADVRFTAILDGEVTPTSSGFAWVGHLQGIERSHVTLVYGDGVLVGSITLPGAAYRVMYTPAGLHVVQEIDASAFPPELEPIEVPESPGSPSLLTGEMKSQTAAADSGARFDVLVVYTAAARSAAGGTTAIQNLINLGVAETNTAYANSAIVPRLRLVHTAEVAYTEAGNLSTDLSRLRSKTDGYMDNVHALRDQYRADLVKLVVSAAASGACGVAYLMGGSSNAAFESSAFSVTARDCISPNYTFGHELGHNMGCNHAPGDGTGTGAYSYSFGYKDPQARFRTVMAYDCSPSCPRVLHFSNPNVNYNGWVTGTSTQNNALSINNVRTVVANFREEVPVYEGYHDIGHCREIYGWAWDQTLPNTSINVDIYRDGTKVATTLASQFRQDLLNAGKGNGYHGFSYTPTSSWKDGVWHSALVRFGGTVTNLGTSPKNIICNVGILTNQVPAEALSTAGAVYTVGTQFSSTHSGYITKLGFHRAPGETGSNTLRLWTDSGVQLAEKPAGCSSAGWCWVDISPVAITAGTRYRVSVNTNTYQSKTGCGIGSGITNQNLTAHSGYWIAGDAFPSGGSCSNFFVDVKFDL